MQYRTVHHCTLQYNLVVVVVYIGLKTRLTKQSSVIHCGFEQGQLIEIGGYFFTVVAVHIFATPFLNINMENCACF